MSSTENQHHISDDGSLSNVQRNPAIQIQSDSLGRIPLRKFSDTSSLDSEESDKSLESDSEESSNSDDGDSEPSHSLSSASEDEEQRPKPAAKKRAATNGKRCFTKRRSKTKGRSKSDGSSSIKLHYKNYHTHFHRRAAHGKFSLIQVLRHWVLTMSQFTSKYHKEIFMVLFCIASGLASLRTG